MRRFPVKLYSGMEQTQCPELQRGLRLIHHFYARLCSRECRGAAAKVELEIPHGFWQYLIVPLTPHQDRTKPGKRCNHATWSLVDLLTAFTWV